MTASPVIIPAKKGVRDDRCRPLASFFSGTGRDWLGFAFWPGFDLRVRRRLKRLFEAVGSTGAVGAPEGA